MKWGRGLGRGGARGNRGRSMFLTKHLGLWTAAFLLDLTRPQSVAIRHIGVSVVGSTRRIKAYETIPLSLAFGDAFPPLCHCQRGLRPNLDSQHCTRHLLVSHRILSRRNQIGRNRRQRLQRPDIHLSQFGNRLDQHQRAHHRLDFGRLVR